MRGEENEEENEMAKRRKRNDDDDSRGSFLFAPGLRVASEADAIRSLRAVLLRKVPVQPPPSSSPPNPIDQSITHSNQTINIYDVRIYPN